MKKSLKTIGFWLSMWAIGYLMIAMCPWVTGLIIPLGAVCILITQVQNRREQRKP
jgi:hypothetical protein